MLSLVFSVCPLVDFRINTIQYSAKQYNTTQYMKSNATLYNALKYKTVLYKKENITLCQRVHFPIPECYGRSQRSSSNDWQL